MKHITEVLVHSNRCEVINGHTFTVGDIGFPHIKLKFLYLFERETLENKTIECKYILPNGQYSLENVTIKAKDEVIFPIHYSCFTQSGWTNLKITLIDDNNRFTLQNIVIKCNALELGSKFSHARIEMAINEEIRNITAKIEEVGETLKDDYIRSVESAKASNINEINLAKTSCIEYVDGIKNDVRDRIDRLETALDSRENEITTLVRTKKSEIENSVNSKISNLERIKNNYINEVNRKNESVETSIRNGLELLENKKNTELDRLSRDIEGRALGIKEDLASFVNERKSEVSSQIQGLDGLNTRIDDLNTKIEAKEEAITTKNTGFNLNKTDSFNEDDTNKLASAKAVHDLGLSLREEINNIEIPASSGGGSGGSDNTRVSKRGDTMTGHLVINKSDCWIKGKHGSYDKWVLGKTSMGSENIELVRSHGNNKITLEENLTKFNKPLNIDFEYSGNKQKLIIGNMPIVSRDEGTSYISGTEDWLILGVVGQRGSGHISIDSEGISFDGKALAFADGIESMIFELMTGNKYKKARDHEDIRRFKTDVFVAQDSDSPRPTPFLKVNESADTFSFNDTESFIPIDNKSLGREIYKIRNAVKYLCEQAGTNIDEAAEEGVDY